MLVLRRLATLGAVGMVALIVAMTLTPLAADGDHCILGVPCTLGHALAFAALGIALAGLYVSSGFARHAPRRALVMLLLALWIFAALTELAQAEIGRDASLLDWGADMAGGIGGLLGGGLLLRALWGSRLGEVAASDESPMRRPRGARR